MFPNLTSELMPPINTKCPYTFEISFGLDSVSPQLVTLKFNSLTAANTQNHSDFERIKHNNF